MPAGLAGYVPSDASLDGLVMRVSVHRGELLRTPRMAATLAVGWSRANAAG